MRAAGACVLAAVWILAPDAARAQSVTTIEQLIVAALEKHPAVVEARARIAAAEGLRVQAGLRPNPSVSGMLREEIGGMDRMTDASITVPLDLFRREARVTTADAGVAVADADMRRVMLALEIDVRRSYGAVLAARRDADVARELEATARTTFDLLAARAEAGAVPTLDRDLARVELERMSARRQSADAGAAAAVIDLTRAMGLRGEAPDAAGSLEAALADPRVTALADIGPTPAKAHPDVVAAEARIRERAAAIDRLRSEAKWDLSLSAGYVRMKSGFPFRAFDAGGTLRGIEGTFHNVTAGAMVMVPIFNRNQGAIAAAVAERAAAEAAAEGAIVAVEAQITRTAIGLRAALDVAARYRTTIVPQASKNLDVVALRYELGGGTLFDVLLARQQLLQVQQEYTDALQRAYDAYVAALGARGGATR